MAKKGVVLAFFEYTGNAVEPWAKAGYNCFCFDLLHTSHKVTYPSGGSITFLWADLTPGSASWQDIIKNFAPAPGRARVAMVLSFPPCTDLAGSGARHFEAKRAKDPRFQEKAAAMASYSAMVAERYLRSEYIVENPVGVLTKLWRKWDYTFDPCDFGGYLPEDDVHPRWPEYIAPRDAYTKKTCIWTSSGVVWPERKPVEPEILERTYITKKGKAKTIRGSRQTFMLGGKSEKVKRIRDEGPRGFLQALFEFNRDDFPLDGAFDE